MNTMNYLPTLGFSIAALAMSTSAGLGATVAFDNASDGAYQPSFSDWGSGDNGGTGFNAWSGLTDIYVGSSGDNGNGNSGSSSIDTTGPSNATGESWALRGDGGTNGSGAALRTLTGGDLGVGQSIQLGFDNGFINDGSSVGFSFQSGGTARFEYFFTGGNSNFTVSGLSNQSTTQGFSDDGMMTIFTLTSVDTFSFTVDFLGTGTTDQTFTGSLKGIDGTGIDTIRFFNFSSSGDPAGNAFYNQLAVVPEPSCLALITLAAVGLAGRRRR